MRASRFIVGFSASPALQRQSSCAPSVNDHDPRPRSPRPRGGLVEYPRRAVLKTNGQLVAPSRFHRVVTAGVDLPHQLDYAAPGACCSGWRVARHTNGGQVSCSSRGIYRLERSLREGRVLIGISTRGRRPRHERRNAGSAQQRCRGICDPDRQVRRSIDLRSLVHLLRTWLFRTTQSPISSSPEADPRSMQSAHRVGSSKTA